MHRQVLAAAKRPAHAGQGPVQAIAQYPGIGGVATYTEDIFVGYRFFAGHDQQPLFPFGHGLSFARFSYENLRVDRPGEVGADRLVNALGAARLYGTPAVVVDFGTSTNFDVVNEAGEFAGGVLAPGIEISMDALFARAARLPKVPFTEPERVISQTTTAALQSGLVYGFAGQVDAIVSRILVELGAKGAPVVATGGLADLIAPHSATITAVDPELTLQGLRLVWERNQA